MLICKYGRIKTNVYVLHLSQEVRKLNTRTLICIQPVYKYVCMEIKARLIYHFLIFSADCGIL